MVPENSMVAYTLDPLSAMQLAEEISKKVPEVKSARALGGYGVVPGVLVTVYVKPKENQGDEHIQQRFGEIEKKIRDINGVTSVETLGLIGPQYEKDESGKLKKFFVE